MGLRKKNKRPLRVELYETTDMWVDPPIAEYRWRVVHTSNGETMASGEGYANVRDRDRAVAVLFPGVTTEQVEQ